MILVKGAWTIKFSFHFILLSYRQTDNAKIPRQRLGYSVRGIFVFTHKKRGEIVAAKTKKTEPKKKKRLGRTPKYETWLESDNLLRLEGWARDGLTDEQIAHNIGINRTTLYVWKAKYTDFSDALKRGKEVVDILVENALLKSAMGYKFDEVVKERIYNPETG